MQRRHFETIAQIINELPEGDKERVAQHFAEKLRNTNPEFNSNRFFIAATTGKMGRGTK